MILILAYLGTIVLANALVHWVGPVPVGFGLMAPAGVYAAGLALTLRDLIQDRSGRRAVVWCILGGAALSAGISGRLALASGVAFLVSELADFAVYTPLRRRSWLGAIAASNGVGLVLDSVLFLALAFGSLHFLAGQVVGKMWITLVTVAVLWAYKKSVQGVSDFEDRDQPE